MHALLKGGIAQASAAIPAAGHLIKRRIRYSPTFLSSPPYSTPLYKLHPMRTSCIAYILHTSNLSCRSDSRARRRCIAPTRPEFPLERMIYCQEYPPRPFRPAPLVRVAVDLSWPKGKGQGKKKMRVRKTAERPLIKLQKRDRKGVCVSLLSTVRCVCRASILPNVVLSTTYSSLRTPRTSLFSV